MTDVPCRANAGSDMAQTPAWPPASLPRLYVAGPLGPDMPIALDRAQANYLGNVLRLDTGDDLLLFDGAHGEWHARITASSKKRMYLWMSVKN